MPDENRRTASRLSPRDPFVLDTRELGRRAGSMRRLSRTVPAPQGLGLDVLGVPAGADVDLDVRLEAVMEGVLVSLRIRVPLAGECVRCLEPLERSLDTEAQELFVYPGSEASDDEAFRLEGDLLDLEPVVRDAVVLTLPLSPVCRDDCPGLCSECGARLADDPEHAHETVDPRWAALQGVFVDDRAGAPRAGGEQET
ncbi:MAG: YceD family protein [Actinomycetes bacterium]